MCFGDNTIDRYVDPVGADFVGGSCVNVAVGLAGQKIDTAYVGPVGDDAAGSAIVAELRAHGVDVSRVGIVAGGGTAVTEIELLPDGDRRFISESYELIDDYQPDADTWSFVVAARHVHTSRFPHLLDRLRCAPSRSFRLSCDFSTWEPPTDLSGVDLAFLSIDPAEGEQRARALATETRERGAGEAVVTLGEHGSLAASGDEIVFQPALPAVVVDTCGAGDAFIAAYIARWLAGARVGERLAAGAQAGARACAALGAFPQLRSSARVA